MTPAVSAPGFSRLIRENNSICTSAVSQTVQKSPRFVLMIWVYQIDLATSSNHSTAKASQSYSYLYSYNVQVLECGKVEQICCRAALRGFPCFAAGLQRNHVVPTKTKQLFRSNIFGKKVVLQWFLTEVPSSFSNRYPIYF